MTTFLVLAGIAAIILAVCVGFGIMVSWPFAMGVANCAIPLCIIIVVAVGYKIYKERKKAQK